MLHTGSFSSRAVGAPKNGVRWIYMTAVIFGEQNTGTLQGDQAGIDDVVWHAQQAGELGYPAARMQADQAVQAQGRGVLGASTWH